MRLRQDQLLIQQCNEYPVIHSFSISSISKRELSFSPLCKLFSMYFRHFTFHYNAPDRSKYSLKNTRLLRLHQYLGEGLYVHHPVTIPFPPGFPGAGVVFSGVVSLVDSGVVDSGVVDSGVALTLRVVDSGVVDSGVVDSGVVDSGSC